MRVLSKDDLEKEKLKLIRNLRTSVFIHPTDTIYGIGCNATERKLVHKVRTIKEQFTRPISVIAPSIDWIYDNCHVTNNVDQWLNKLPGPYTFILKLKNKDAVSRNVHLGDNTIGVRLPRHWFTKVVSDLQVPIISTSANLTGKNYMRGLDTLDPNIKKQIDLAIYVGVIEGSPSKVVDLSKETPEVLRH